MGKLSLGMWVCRRLWCPKIQLCFISFPFSHSHFQDIPHQLKALKGDLASDAKAQSLRQVASADHYLSDPLLISGELGRLFRKSAMDNQQLAKSDFSKFHRRLIIIPVGWGELGRQRGGTLGTCKVSLPSMAGGRSLLFFEIFLTRTV